MPVLMVIPEEIGGEARPGTRAGPVMMTIPAPLTIKMLVVVEAGTEGLAVVEEIRGVEIPP